jgi:hypothetical protein
VADHHPDAAEAIDQWLVCGADPHTDLVTDLLDYLSCAGLAVVKVGEAPPWMEQLRNSGGLYGHLHSKESLWWLFPFSELANGCRPLYVVKEQDR